jgi:hypothetical protein
MLLVPLTCCIIACDVSCKIRPFFSERAIDYAQLVAATFLSFTLMLIQVGQAPSLTTAVRPNIEKTNLFYNELQRAVVSAKAPPDAPIILEAYVPAHTRRYFPSRITCRRSGPGTESRIVFIPIRHRRESLMKAFGKRCPGSSRRATTPSRPCQASWPGASKTASVSD